MKKNSIISIFSIIAVYIAAGNIKVIPEEVETNSFLRQYNNLANNFIDQQSWDGQTEKKLTEIDRLQYQKLQVLSKVIVQNTSFNEDVLKIFANYEEHDGYARQALYSALIDYASNLDDSQKDIGLAFLKQIFLESLKCEKGDYPNRLHGWYSPDDFRVALALRISNIVLPPKDGSSYSLSAESIHSIRSSPRDWINKQIP